jgi:cell division protein FtsQ
MQQVWRKRWRNTGWIALGAITLVVLASAVHKKNHRVCSGIEVAFSEEGNNFFVDERGVVAILKQVGPIKGEEIKSIDLNALEARMKSDRWIADAELFFDNKQVLQVIIEEKEPVARIFTVGGSSFYIDSACRRLPLSEKLSARIPMFTSFPSDVPHLSRPDSQLLASVKQLAMFIQADEFWKAQVAQVDITPEGFEMIPTVGNHVVELGKYGEWQRKFDQLFSFYKQVWTKVGFERYERIDVQFSGQVVATLKGSKPVLVDSIQARRAYETLLADEKKAVQSSVSVPAPRFAVSREIAGTNSPEMQTDMSTKTTTRIKKELLAKENIVQSTSKKETSKVDDKKKVPKAVMKKSG